MTIEHTLLGLLAIEPRHGYELSRVFSSDPVLADIVHLDSGMLYAHLKKMEKNGWVRAQVVEQDARPPRRVFELTPEGTGELQSWIQDPVEKTRDIRLEFILKYWISRQIAPESCQQLLNRQEQACRGFVDSLQLQIDQEPDDFHQLVLEMRLVQNQALLRWLERAKAAEATI